MKSGILWKLYLRRILFLGLIVIVCAGCAGSDSDDDNNIPAGDSLPIADAGPDQDVFINLQVTLDGSGSSSVNNDTLTYNWTVIPPEGSTAKLSNPSIENPTFTPDISGSYEIGLIVNDGTDDSLQSTAMYVASPIYLYGFEEGIGSWLIEEELVLLMWEVGAPDSLDYGPDGPYSGANCAGTVLNGPYPNRLLPFKSGLISPSIQLPDIEPVEHVDKIYLSFFHWFEFDLANTGIVYMSWELSPDVWGEWEQLEDANFSGEVTEWSEVIAAIEISDYSPDKKLRFKFELSAGFHFLANRAGWYLDDIEVSF